LRRPTETYSEAKIGKIKMSKSLVKLKNLGIELPDPPTPSANYIPAKLVGNLVYVSGQIPLQDGREAFVGKVGADVSVQQAQVAARICAINILAQLSKALGGDLDRVRSVVRLGGFVNAIETFSDHPTVINGASDLMVAVFGDSGRHARAAVGTSSLPRNCAVEVEGIFEIDT
jgi:enamine deaminase RidA (YjgF/YER057c/UK114 family)